MAAASEIRDSSEMAEDESCVKRQPFSFQIKKKIENRFSESKSVDDDDASKSKDFVLFVEDREIASSKPKEEKKALVIPLIKNNVWRVPKRKGGESRDSRDIQPSKEPSLDELAVQELVSEALQDAGNGTDKKLDSKGAIPLVMQNKIPDGFETDDKMDVSLRPDEPTIDDYERVPIEEYGLAVLRGMGWKPGAPVGGTNKQCVKPVEVVIRPKGLGLGADRSLLEQTKKQEKLKSEDSREDLQLAKGAYVKVRHGQKKGLYGQVEGLDQENARILIRLALGGKVVSVPEFVVEVVTQKEYSKEAKCINAEKYKEATSNKSEQESRGKRKGGHRRRSRSDEESSGSSHDKRRRDDDGARREKSEMEERNEDGSRTWVQPELRVRFIDREYKNGKYFNTKLVVEGVTSANQISCRTDEGRVLSSIRASMLETVVPRKEPSVIMVVQGKYKGHIGRVMERDKANCIATIELYTRKGKVTKLEYDSICEYIGRTGQRPAR